MRLRLTDLLTHLSSSGGRLNTQDCWKGQEPDESTCDVVRHDMP